MSGARGSWTIAIVGGGPAGLMAAEVTARAGVAVTVYDRMASPARKFLLAGRGGLNLTHSEPFERLLSRYGAAAPALEAALRAFDPAALRAWSASLGQPTVVGSSGRVFPHDFKTSPLLRAWLRRLEESGVRFRPRHRWTGWTPEGDLAFETPAGAVTASADATVLALGGASWPRLGSDGAWTTPLEAAGIAIAPLRPSNCGFAVAWSPMMAERHEGQPLKSIALSFGDRSVRGEAIVTRAGLEGGAVYALCAALRDAIAAQGHAVLHVALRPDLDAGAIARRLAAQPAKASLATRLRKALGLSPAAIGVLQEALHAGEAGTPVEHLVNAVPVRLMAPMPITEAISTAGGVRLAELDDTSMLRRRPGVFAAGEMLDWEAPTGGYLLQASLSTGAAAASGALGWLGHGGPARVASTGRADQPDAG